MPSPAPWAPPAPLLYRAGGVAVPGEMDLGLLLHLGARTQGFGCNPRTLFCAKRRRPVPPTPTQTLSLPFLAQP